MQHALLFFFSLCCSFCMAQNLVPNSSFEQIGYCPQANELNPVIGWSSPTQGTPDYFNSCNGSVPQNLWGYQNANTGSAYIGISTANTDAFREYIQCQLIQPLEAEKSYIVTFYVSRGDSSGGASDNIGAYFSTTAISSLNPKYLPYTPQVSSESNSPITNDTDWVLVSGIYPAIGGEQYLTIGVFSDNANTDWILVNSNSEYPQQAYYFIDDVSVTEYSVSVPLQMPTAFSPNGDSKNDTYYPVFFDSLLIVHEFRIYNRWGQLIYDNPTTGWNGNYKGEPQPQGVYSYYIYADIPLPDNPNNERSTLKKQGSFTLLR